jgi:hypothetical protein
MDAILELTRPNTPESSIKSSPLDLPKTSTGYIFDTSFPFTENLSEEL